ncbi:MAG: hypothetical protein NTU73_00235, partial [Ignavibacteriae bacterium]|nr:hypothetical protein [Ignavibacteriota bacterium]
LFNKKPSLKKVIEDFKIEDSKPRENMDLSKMQEFLEKFTKNYPNDQEGHYFLGYIYDRKSSSDGSNIPSLDIGLSIKASAEFEKIIEINPDYKGEYYILSPYSKISGIWSSIALKYALEEKYDSSRWAFKKGKELGGFSNTILDYAKSMMSSSEKNAIIFTSGDMVTFPMWYLQFMDKYRRDITVVDLSLLNASWYRERILSKDLFGDYIIRTSFTDKQVEELDAIEWTPKIVSISIPKNILKEYKVINEMMLKTERLQWVLPAMIKDGLKEGIRVQDIMVEDIISYNNWKRPVYFTTQMPEENFIGLSEYLPFSGVLRKLTPNSSVVNFFKFDTASTNISLFGEHKSGSDVYRTGIKWDGLYNINKSYDRDLLIIQENYRIIFFAYLDYLIKERNFLLNRVFERMEEKIPSDKLIPDYRAFLTMKTFYEAANLVPDFETIRKKIEKAATEKLEKEEFTSINFSSFITLAVLYRELNEYDKAEKLLETLKTHYREDEKINYHLKEIKSKNNK